MENWETSPKKGGNVRKNVWDVKTIVENWETPPKGGNVRINVRQTKAEKLKAKDICKMMFAN